MYADRFPNFPSEFHKLQKHAMPCLHLRYIIRRFSSSAIQDDRCAEVSGRRFAALRRYLSEAHAAGNVLPSLPAALQCKASSTSHFTRTYLGLRRPNVCKIEKYAYAQNPKIKKSVVCSCVSPFALTNPWAGTLCERVCVWNCVRVSTPSGGGWKLPTPAASSVPPACPAPHSWA